MNSRDNSNFLFEGPLYKTDPETGRRILLPLIRKGTSSNSKVKSSEKVNKREWNIAPFRLTAADFEEPPDKGSKMRKMDNHSVRKELFHLPAKESRVSRSSLITRKTFERKSITAQKTHQKRFKPSELSPLLDMEEVEEELIKKKVCLQGYPFKTPNKPSINFTKNSGCKKQLKSQEKNLPKILVNGLRPSSESSSESDFLELEKMCCEKDPTQDNEYNKSPVSSVCSLLEGTMINSSKKGKNGMSGDVKIIQQTMNNVENLLTEYNKAFEAYNASHEQNICKIMELLETDRKQYKNLVTLKNKSDNAFKGIINELKKCTSAGAAAEIEANKENTPKRTRRSLRLLNKSPVQASGAKMIVSPAVLKSNDLRKSTLKKNLATKSKEYNIESPRIQKALDMYNSMRCEISILATPKLDRSCLNESPRSANLSRNLSRRVQNQCLLLQDTPIHL